MGETLPKFAFALSLSEINLSLAPVNPFISFPSLSDCDERRFASRDPGVAFANFASISCFLDCASFIALLSLLIEPLLLSAIELLFLLAKKPSFPSILFNLLAFFSCCFSASLIKFSLLNPLEYSSELEPFSVPPLPVTASL